MASPSPQSMSNIACASLQGQSPVPQLGPGQRKRPETPRYGHLLIIRTQAARPARPVRRCASGILKRGIGEEKPLRLRGASAPFVKNDTSIPIVRNPVEGKRRKGLGCQSRPCFAMIRGSRGTFSPSSKTVGIRNWRTDAFAGLTANFPTLCCVHST
jgi:hypothetical protein